MHDCVRLIQVNVIQFLGVLTIIVPVVHLTQEKNSKNDISTNNKNNNNNKRMFKQENKNSY